MNRSAVGIPVTTMVAMKMKDEIMIALCLAGLSKAFSEPRRQFLIDAVEAAIGEDRHHVAGLEVRRNAVDDRLHIGTEFGLRFRPAFSARTTSSGCSRSASGMRCC